MTVDHSTRRTCTAPSISTRVTSARAGAPTAGGEHSLCAQRTARRDVLACAPVHTRPPRMTTTLSIRIDADTKKRLEALAKRSRRSKSFLAAEAIAAFVEAKSWQLDEIQIGIKDLDEGRGVPHNDVANWLRSWGRKRERRGRARHTVCDSLQGLRRPTRSDRGFPRSAEMAEASVSWSETECLLDARREAGPGMPLDSRSRAGLRFWWNLVGPCSQGVTRIERQVFAGADEGCTVHTARISAQRRAGVLTPRRCSLSHGRHVPLSDSFSRGGVSACAVR